MLFWLFPFLNLFSQTFLSILINGSDLALGFGLVKNDFKVNQGHDVFWVESLVLRKCVDYFGELLVIASWGIVRHLDVLD